MHNTIFLGPFLGLFMDNAEVKEAAEKAQSQDLSFKAAVKLAEVSLSLGDGRLSDAGQQAEDLRSLATELPPNESRLQTLALSMQVTTQLARVRNDDAMQAAMELLTAQRRQDKQAEAAAWLRIAEVHRHREMVTMGTTGVGTSTAEDTLQAAERSADIYTSSLSGFSADGQSESRRGMASAHVEAGRACLRRRFQSISLASPWESSEASAFCIA
jgi:hypothetical protein